MGEFQTGIGFLLATSMALSACSSPDTIPPPVAVRATTAPIVVLLPKTIATRTPMPSELDMEKSKSVLEFVLDKRHTALINKSGEPLYFTDGNKDYSENIYNYPPKPISDSTRVTSSALRLKIPNSRVTISTQLYKIGESSPQSDKNLQESFTFVINYYKHVLEKALLNKQIALPENQDAIRLINQDGGVEKYIEKRLANFSDKNIVSIWGNELSDGDGPLYVVILPPPRQSSNNPLPNAEKVRQIITQKTKLDNVGSQMLQLIEAMDADSEFKERPWMAKASDEAGACLYHYSGKFSIAISIRKSHLNSSSDPRLQKNDVPEISAEINEWTTIIGNMFDPTVLELLNRQIITDTGVDKSRFEQAASVNPDFYKELVSSIFMLQYQKSVLATYK